MRSSLQPDLRFVCASRCSSAHLRGVQFRLFRWQMHHLRRSRRLGRILLRRVHTTRKGPRRLSQGGQPRREQNRPRLPAQGETTATAVGRSCCIHITISPACRQMTNHELLLLFCQQIPKRLKALSCHSLLPSCICTSKHAIKYPSPKSRLIDGEAGATTRQRRTRWWRAAAALALWQAARSVRP